MAYRLSLITKNKYIRSIRSYFPSTNFITVHYAYFLIVCLIASGIFWGTSDPVESVAYVDALFCVVSAMTEAGLNTVNLSTMTTFQQFILWFLIMIGSSIWVSIFTVLTRKRVFESRFKHVVKSHRASRKMRRRSLSASREVPVDARLAQSQKEVEPVDNSDFESRHSMPRDPISGLARDLVAAQPSDLGDDEIHPAQPNSRALTFPADVGANQKTSSYQSSGIAGVIKRASKSTETIEGNAATNTQYPSYLTRYNTGRNARFYDLSQKERDHLGGVEYRAISMLAYIVPVYFVLWQLIGCLGMGAYMAYNKPNVALSNGINPWWLGAFNSVSAFNNSGMSLLDLNMIPFQRSTYPLFTMGLLILAGNTAYPLFLRLIIWSLLQLLNIFAPSENSYSEHKETLRFVLQYPRRVYTNLFPKAATWWLFFVVVLLNSIDWVAFELLNIGNPAVESIPKNHRILDGLFQALAVRSGGFYVIALPTVRIGLQVLYVIMMYISVYPVVITMRHSNVYEERSLGIYADDPILATSSASSSIINEKQQRAAALEPTVLNFFKRTLSNGNTTRGSEFIKQQVRGQLSHDLWIIVLAVLFITCIEVTKFERDPVSYSVFNVLFEVVSAYGCVGISMGVPNDAYSFSGGLGTASKLILCLVMITGRHRGLPVALDRAVRLPSENENEESEVDDAAMMTRGRLSMTV
ncbi:cation transporter [Phlyctema vagabunda]|uniref:Cation transporter n=1 Tax=Phlyctema vagabunda TaxID=108571 RepID=A0ABR4P463_9HELO